MIRLCRFAHLRRCRCGVGIVAGVMVAGAIDDSVGRVASRQFTRGLTHKLLISMVGDLTHNVVLRIVVLSIVVLSIAGPPHAVHLDNAVVLHTALHGIAADLDTDHPNNAHLHDLPHTVVAHTVAHNTHLALILPYTELLQYVHNAVHEAAAVHAIAVPHNTEPHTAVLLPPGNAPNVVRNADDHLHTAGLHSAPQRTACPHSAQLHAVLLHTAHFRVAIHIVHSASAVLHTVVVFHIPHAPSDTSPLVGDALSLLIVPGL